MGLNKGPFVAADTVSVLNPYGGTGSITLAADGDSEIVATVDVCVTQPEKTQVSLDSMTQIAVTRLSPTSDPVILNVSVTFEVRYEILRNGNVIATINDEMDYEAAGEGRHTNFPNFPILDDNPNAGINTYDLKVTRVSTSVVEDIFVASRSLKATVMGLNKGLFVVADTVSVIDALSVAAGAIELVPGGVPTVVATVEVCVKEPLKTQVSLDSMAQIAVITGEPDVTFEMTYELLRNGVTIATIDNSMDYISLEPVGYTNFPNFPLVDDTPSAGINTYVLRCTFVSANAEIFVGSRSLKATVITV
ncbi:hypothetical protein [Chengkuizengella sediminis]|uniref:hypothetical protein n=1 Tax=Chengkuizengella sediminis TaxID=1885917 RepID=UPI00138A509F|nr:hypothetical protein [Chengkuizengella sediminis]NDI34641.1 hypothetical protein [Chengkuizengella sediminis]